VTASSNASACAAARSGAPSASRIALSTRSWSTVASSICRRCWPAALPRSPVRPRGAQDLLVEVALLAYTYRTATEPGSTGKTSTPRQPPAAVAPGGGEPTPGIDHDAEDHPIATVANPPLDRPPRPRCHARRQPAPPPGPQGSPSRC
jgi:hypothetical protein